MANTFELKENNYTLDRGYWINYWEIEEDTPNHTHDFVEMVYTFNGNAVHIVNGREIPVRKGDLLFLNYNCTHSIKPIGKLRYADIMFKLDYIDHGLNNSGNAFSLLETKNFSEFESMINTKSCVIHFRSHERGQLEQLIEWTLREQDAGETCGNFMIRSILNLILILVFRKMKFPMNDSFPINQDLLDYINENCSEQITLKDIAEKNFYTLSHLCVQFKAYTGMNFTKYLMDCRIKKAIKMICETDRSIEDIIYDCGFSNRTRFFRLFREKTGQTPFQYRNSNQRKDKLQ